MMLALPTDLLLEAKHLHRRVRTEADYRARHLEALNRFNWEYPHLRRLSPWVTISKPPIYVTESLVQIRCATPGCYNAPAVSIEWRLALCWDCGAVYEGLEVPPKWPDVSRVLLARPDPATRNWLPGETVDGLIRENAEHSIGEAA